MEENGKMDRRKELVDAAEEIQKELFASHIRELEAEYRKQERREEAGKAFAELFQHWKRQGDRKARCLGICYRYGSMLMGTYELRLVLYGEDFYLDRNPEVCVWKPPCFFEMFEKDMEVILKKLKSTYPRIYVYEEDAVRLRCVEYYLAALHRLCMDMTEEILHTEEFRRMKRADDFYIFFGRYRGEGEILYRAGEAAPDMKNGEDKKGREDGEDRENRKDRENRRDREEREDRRGGEDRKAGDGRKEGEDREEGEGRGMRRQDRGRNHETEKEYYVLVSQDGNPMPRIVNWYGKLDVRKINRVSYRELSGHILLDMKAGTDTVYPDILTDPVLMVSAEAKQVIKKYEEEMPFLFVALFDTESEESVVYYCPVLAEGNGTGEYGEALYLVRTEKGSEVRIRADLAESLLARGAVGMKLERMDGNG